MGAANTTKKLGSVDAIANGAGRAGVLSAGLEGAEEAKHSAHDVLGVAKEMAPGISDTVGAEANGGFVQGAIGAKDIAANPLNEMGHMGDQAQIGGDAMKYGSQAFNQLGKLSPVARGLTGVGNALATGAEKFSPIGAGLAAGQMAYQTGQLIAHPEKIGEQADSINKWSGDNGHNVFANAGMRAVQGLGNAPATIAATGQAIGQLAQVTAQNASTDLKNMYQGNQKLQQLGSPVYQPSNYAKNPMFPK